MNLPLVTCSCRWMALVLLCHAALSAAQASPPPASTPGKPPWADATGVDPYGTWADITVGSVTQRLRWIPPGSFQMGSPTTEAGRDPDELPHPVGLSRGFWLGDSEVTRVFWQVVLGTDGSKPDGRDQFPIDGISWDDSRRFFARLEAAKPGLQATFPTEAQWEYACRAGSALATYGPIEEVAWCDRNSGLGVHPVRQKKPNAWGLYDMLGNMWERCADWYGDYPATATDPAGPANGKTRIARGGSYNSSPIACRAAWRGGDNERSARRNLGLRISVPAKQ